MNRRVLSVLPVRALVRAVSPALAALAVFAFTTVAPIAGAADAIPERPEKLTFPPLTYEPPNPASFRVPLASGPVAYVVPSRELPLVNIVVYVRVGDYLQPVGKEGIAGLTGYLLARGGINSMTAEALEERMAFLAANLGSGVADLQGTVSLNLLSKDLDEGLKVLREVLAEPTFQEDKITLRKQQILQSLKQRNDDSADIEVRERRFLTYGENFWVNRHPTAVSVESLTRADLQAFHKKWFHPGNFVVAVNGDFDRDAMVARLEKLFADWPYRGEKSPPVPGDAKFADPGLYIVDKDVNQGRVSMILPGIRRDNPDFYAAQVMNDVLGGGGFTSRIMNRVRSDEGLAYSAGSAFPGGVYYPLIFIAAFQSKSRTVAYATSIVLEEFKRIAKEPVTDEEIQTTVKSMVESFPRAFSTKGQVAATFAQDELTGRFATEPDYWKNYRSKIAAVTKTDIQRVAQKYLLPEKLVVCVVGQKKEILLGHPDHPVKVDALAGNRIVDVPLRDPLTMKPVTP